MKKAWVFFLLACLLLAGMASPELDRQKGPFSYFAYPVDVIGLMDCREGAEVTPEGYLYTGYGELVFFYGNPPVPVNQRIKTLYRGHFPVIQYSFSKNGVRYSVEMFAFTLDGKPESPLINFIKISIKNLTSEPRTAYWWVGTRYSPPPEYPFGIPPHRFRRPAKAAKPGLYEQEGEEFNPNWAYEFADGMLLRSGKAFYFYPEELRPTKWITLRTPYSRRWRRPAATPSTVVGLVRFEVKLDPGSSKSFVIKMPYSPVPKEKSQLIKQIKEADYEDYLSRTISFWEDIFSRGMRIELSEPKVVDTFMANLVYDLIARDKIGPYYVQKVNEFQYDAFWLRDGSYIVRAYDVTGYHKIAEQCLDFFLLWQRSDGNFLSQRGQYDGWGQALWAFGQHYLITGDSAFAKRFFPAVERAVRWLHQARQKDPLRIMPVTTPGDNELITGHVTGHNFWALAGLKMAIAMAEGLGYKDKARWLRREYKDYYKHFLRALRRITRRTGGYIPPGLDDVGGQDWGNLLAVYPVKILRPFDPMVTKTLQVTRRKYREGLMTYGDLRWMHHYLTMKNTETAVIRGEQKQALREFYSILLHTSSTHAGFEFKIEPWGDRDFGYNLSPHGWFAAKFRTLVRNMLVREEDGRLHLLSVVSPRWLRPGDSIVVERAPTDFGVVSFRLHAGKGRAVLEYSARYRKRPSAVVVHLPWFAQVLAAEADGRRVKVKKGKIFLRPDFKKLVLRWKLKQEQGWSYASFVEEYKKKFSARYRQYLKYGEEVRKRWRD